MKPLYCLFGGTFDPFHYGHMLSCLYLYKEINIQKIIIIPNNIPPHKKIPTTSSWNRIDMINLSIENKILFSINTLEIKKKQISYTIQTLKTIKKEMNNKISLGFIIGDDNLETFNNWHDWRYFLKFCHIIVCPRKKKKIILKNTILNQWIQNYQIKNQKLLHKYSCGCIFFSNTPIINISSTKIRNLCMNKKKISKFVHWKVEKYIINNKLYQNKI